MKKEFLETGKIVGTHGIKGEMRVQPWCDSPDFLLQFTTLYLDGGKTPLKVTASRAHGNVVLLKVCGVDSIEQAERMRNRVLFINRADVSLDDGDWFIQDLIGCEVFDADSSRRYGRLTDVSRTGANDVWHITADDGVEYLVPAVPSVVRSVDIDGEKILISPMAGIFSDEESICE